MENFLRNIGEGMFIDGAFKLIRENLTILFLGL